jgi:hypothetical protein
VICNFNLENLMNLIKQIVSLLAIVSLTVLVGCGDNYEGVPPNYIGMILTPTGYENKIYTPGQADIGDKATTTGMANSLVLIQRSGLQVKEGFIGRDASPDKEDHRCLSADRLPFTLDVRLLLALPDQTTEAGKKDLQRLFLLGNPKKMDGKDRVMVLDAQQIYADQAQQEVRGRIRNMCAKMADFKAAFEAFQAKDKANLSRMIEHEVASVLKLKGVPLGIVSVEVSNLKPDQSVTDALVQQAAAREQQKTIDDLSRFLQGSPARLTIYQIQVNREIAMAGIAKGNGFIYQVGSGQSTMPIPVGGATTVTEEVQTPPKK